MWLNVWVAVSVAFACLGAWVARERNREPAFGVFLGLVFGPIGVIVLAALPSRIAQSPRRYLSRSNSATGDDPLIERINSGRVASDRHKMDSPFTLE